jgi:tRNA pseudouridine32 synthase/23S rRNA pseudouridine746 synthase
MSRKGVLKIDIVFENEDFVLVNKPAGLSFHSEDGPGLVVILCEQLEVEQLYSVHRLDKMTSGLLILAKRSEVANALSRRFEERKIEKFYLALSMRKPKKKQGWIKGDMGPSRRGSYKLLSTHENPAVTQFISTALRTHERFFLVKPHTGKTHQIRVALKSLGSPVAGDMRYAASDDAKTEDRGYLHAYALRFTLNGELFSFVCLPDEGERFLSHECIQQLTLWSEPWALF